jgi:hypothetical protein
MNRKSLLAGVVFAALTAGVVPMGSRTDLIGLSSAHAQNLGQRTVTGTVLSAESTPVAGATVFLKNLKTKAIRSYTSVGNGHFHFAQINMVDDYDLWAEKDGKKSIVKTVSSWDTRKEFEVELKMK